MALTSAGARRGEYLRANLRSRAAFWGLFFGISVSLVGGAAIGDLRLVAGGPALTALVVFLTAYGNAAKRAEQEFFALLAPTLGLEYSGHGWASVPFTPLLAAGDRRRYEHTMEGPLFGQLGGPRCLLGHYTFETDHEAEAGGNDMKVSRPHPFTVCAIDIGEPLARFRGLYLRPRLSGLGLEHDWLKRAPRPERVELESARFNEIYDLRRANDQDELALRELFSPSFVVWLTEHPLQPGFECKAGTLVVFLRGHEESAGKVTLLHEAAREISRRLAKQVGQGGLAASAPSAAA